MVHKTKKFLEPTGDANSYVVTSVDGEGNISLTIGDCNRNVTLEFGYADSWNRRTKAQVRAKAKKLQQALDEIVGAIET